jgi:hypothetical protein
MASNTTFHAVAAKDIDTVIFAGEGSHPSGGFYGGLVYQWKKNGNPLWSHLSPDPAHWVWEISDVVITGTTAYAVGEKRVGGPNGVRSGVVLTSTFSNGSFGTFTPLSGTPAFPLCLSNEPADDLDEVPALIEAEIDPSGNLWVGGQCGRVWRRTSAGSWTEFKSQTNTHILGISFGVNGSSVMGYFTGDHDEFPQGCVVRYQ